MSCGRQRGRGQEDNPAPRRAHVQMVHNLEKFVNHLKCSENKKQKGDQLEFGVGVAKRFSIKVQCVKIIGGLSAQMEYGFIHLSC